MLTSRIWKLPSLGMNFYVYQKLINFQVPILPWYWNFTNWKIAQFKSSPVRLKLAKGWKTVWSGLWNKWKVENECGKLCLSVLRSTQCHIATLTRITPCHPVCFIFVHLILFYINSGLNLKLSLIRCFASVGNGKYLNDWVQISWMQQIQRSRRR